MTVIEEPRRLRQENCKLGVSLDYTVKLFQNRKRCIFFGT